MEFNVRNTHFFLQLAEKFRVKRQAELLTLLASANGASGFGAGIAGPGDGGNGSIICSLGSVLYQVLSSLLLGSVNSAIGENTAHWTKGIFQYFPFKLPMFFCYFLLFILIHEIKI